jgi:hypothetical protein
MAGELDPAALTLVYQLGAKADVARRPLILRCGTNALVQRYLLPTSAVLI